MIKKILILFFLLVIISLPSFSHSAILISPTNSKSKLEYALSCFKIPFKIKSLPVTASLDVKRSPAEDLLLNSIELSANFTSKNIFFRKLIDYEKYPGISFKSSLENPVILKNKDEFEIIGDLSFHGVTNKIKMKLKSRLRNEKLAIFGSIKIEMDDFGIKPPVLLFVPVDNVIKTKVVLYANLN